MVERHFVSLSKCFSPVSIIVLTLFMAIENGKTPTCIFSVLTYGWLHLHLHKHLSRSQWPLDRHGRCNPLPPFYFQLLLRSRKTSTLCIQRYCSPNASFVGPFFSLFALFLVESSWQALMILMHAQTTLTCVSLLWLRYHHGAQWLAWFCLWQHR